MGEMCWKIRPVRNPQNREICRIKDFAEYNDNEVDDNGLGDEYGGLCNS